MKVHYGKFQYTEDNILAGFPVCGSLPILPHEGNMITVIKKNVTCKKCRKTKVFIKAKEWKPKLTVITDPPKMWSPCWYEQGADHCTTCDKGKEHKEGE